MGQPRWAFDGLGPFPGLGGYFLRFVQSFPLPPLPSFPLVVSLPIQLTLSVPLLPVVRFSLCHGMTTTMTNSGTASADPGRESDTSACWEGSEGPSHQTCAPKAQQCPPRREGVCGLCSGRGQSYTAQGLRESLAACSASLKKQVAGHKLLKRKNPIGALDLGRLARAAGLSCNGRRLVEVAASSTTMAT